VRLAAALKIDASVKAVLDLVGICVAPTAAAECGRLHQTKPQKKGLTGFRCVASFVVDSNACPRE
jgi:hypothetical protein